MMKVTFPVKYKWQGTDKRLPPLLMCIFFSLILIPASAQTTLITDIDNNYDDWQNIRPLATFSINFSPVYFQQEKSGNTLTLGIEEARFWKRAGTLLKTIKACKDKDVLYMYIESHSNFAENFSLFLYLFKERNKKTINTCTMEIIPVTTRKGEGLILLWKKGEKKPHRCGKVMASEFQMELSLPLKDLPSEFQAGFSKLSFDVSTCYQQKTTGLYEDYFYTTLYTRDIR